VKASGCKWPLVNMGDHVDLLAGFAFKSSCFTDNASDIPLVKGENLHQGFIDWEGSKRWPFTEYEKYEPFQLKLNDVVLAMDRPWIEAGLKFSWIRKRDPKSLLVQRVARMRGRNGLLSGYLRFIVGSPDFTGYIQPIVTGVNVPHISGDQIRSFRFCLPPLPTQRKIATILSAYDDLIENNLRRIKILEEMAQNLYREWFVKFRFPGHQHARFTNSPLGRIPEGWEVKRLGDILGLNYGKALKQEDRCGGEVPVYGSSGVVGYHDVPLVNGPGIVVGRKGNVGSVYWCDKNFYPIDTAYFVTSKMPLLFLFYDLQTKNFLNNDAAVPGLNRNQAYSLETVKPPEDILTRFCQFADDFERQSAVLRLQNTILRHTRDLLLPRLISGEVDVSELDIAVAEVAEA
jgi:type I restriction enzyme S subunit